MLDFMDYIQLAFAEATNWNRDNSYSSLTATAQSILDFSTPERLRVHLSSLSTPHFATSYTLGTVGVIDGSVSYLFSTVPFDDTPSRSTLIPLRKIAPGYRQVQAPVAPVRELIGSPAGHHGENGQQHYNYVDQKPTLLHATLHLPPPTTLNALVLRRISPTMQWSLAVCSTRGPPLSKSAPQASLLTQLSHDTGKYSNEYLFSTDNALFGWRGLWNFGPDPRKNTAAGSGSGGGKSRQLLSLLSAGAEAYYSPLSSLVGMSTGLRFSTLPAATGVPSSSSSSSSTTTTTNNHHPISTFPYTLTLTLTPFTGSLSTTYSLRASPNLAFSSRFAFNVYSWESEMVAGCELWRQTRKPKADDGNNNTDDGLEWARRKMRMNMDSLPTATTTQPSPPINQPPITDNNNNKAKEKEKEKEGKEERINESVVKIRIDQSWNVRILWEGRVKELLISAGVGLGPSSFASGSSSLSSTSTTASSKTTTTTTGASSSSSSSSSGGQSAGGGGPGCSAASSYWRGVGVSVLYSS